MARSADMDSKNVGNPKLTGTRPATSQAPKTTTPESSLRNRGLFMDRALEADRRPRGAPIRDDQFMAASSGAMYQKSSILRVDGSPSS